ncbi:hypothetical protein MHK_008650 [Candidatus Magnetomorum sp. HK-1]|nr:hypothetical protein MHK_008650 [Candidatus Magnetomorum sp. HK-1]
MSLQTQFIKFEEKIRLTWQDDRLKKIREKDESIRKNIRDAFKEAGYPIIDFFKQGSYATKTTIVPLAEDYDIDVGVVVDTKNAPENPVDAKKTLKKVLEKRNFKEPKIKLPCVTAQYYKQGDPHFHLDYPVYKKDENDNYYISIGKEHSNEEIRKWEESDPKGLINWLNKLDDFSDEKSYYQYKRLVKYIKKWRDFKFSNSEKKNVYSIGLAVMIRESFQNAISSDGDITDIKSLKDTVDRILSNHYFKKIGYDSNSNAQYEIVVKLSKKPYRNIFEKHRKTVGTLIFNRLTKLSNHLQNVLNETNVKKQSEILRDKVFGDDFPVPENENSENKKFKESGFVASPQGA